MDGRGTHKGRFNRTSFQQQLKLDSVFRSGVKYCFNRTSFQQQLKPTMSISRRLMSSLQSYILSTTTETARTLEFVLRWIGFNRTSFQQQLKPIRPRESLTCLVLQSYILSTTTETGPSILSFFRKSRLQSYILSTTTETFFISELRFPLTGFNRTSFQQQLKLLLNSAVQSGARLQSYILSTTTETHWPAYVCRIWMCFNRTSFQQQPKL